jgi:N-acetyl-alpha-D-glucosaminyl L-malate synthase BshA
MRLNTAQPNITFHEVEAATYPVFDHAPYTLALAVKMAEVAEIHHLDLIHCHYAIPHSVSAFLAKSMLNPRRLPVVTTLHGTDITLVGAERSYLPITRFSIEQSDGVTAVSQHLKDATRNVIGAKKEIEVIYNFVNCEKYRQSGDSELRGRFAPDGESILVHISNFRAVKRPVDVVEIFGKVREKIPAVLLMIGDGPERGHAERRAREKRMDGRAHFLGKQDNIEQWLGISDLLLLPSEMESFGLVALEAMACEVPVVASRVGGIPEVITDGIEGFLAGVGDINNMADRALDILKQPQARLEMGRRAREKARTFFSSDAIISAYEAHYRRVLGG